MVCEGVRGRWASNREGPAAAVRGPVVTLSNDDERRRWSGRMSWLYRSVSSPRLIFS